MKLQLALAALLFFAANACSSNPGAAAGNAVPAGGAMWQKYLDPLEQAFTLDVPTGWTVKGGMFRMGYSDHRFMVDMTSPDGKQNVRLGDLAIPTYFLPDQLHREGMVADLGAQAQGRYARYRQGDEFARSYARVRFARVCQSLTPQAATLPSIPRLPAPPGASQYSDGEATFACGDRVAFVYAQTVLSGRLWQVAGLASYVAPAADVGQVRSIIAHSVPSIQMSPAWIQKQNQLDQEALVYQRQRQQMRMQALAAQQRQFEAQMQGMRNQVAAFERGQAQRNSQFEAMDHVISGITPATDPYGNETTVFNGPHNHYWINPASGQKVNSDQSPGPGWQPLTLHN